MTFRLPLTAAILTAVAALGCGCDGRKEILALTEERDKALDDARGLREQVEQLRGELAERDKQIKDLTGLGDKRLDKLFVVQRIHIRQATGGVNLDEKPGDEGVKVFLQPIDQHGSAIKAAGDVTIQIYDLAAPEKENLLCERHVGVDEVAGHWSSGLFTSHYSFTCRWRAGPPAHDELTVRVELLDYLTGKRYTAQKVVKVALPPKKATE